MSKVLFLEFGSLEPILPESWKDIDCSKYRYNLKFENGVYVLRVTKR